MKSKILITAAFIALMAAGCNKAVDNADDQATQQQDQNQGIAVGEPNGQNADNLQQPTDTNKETPKEVAGDVADTPQVIEVKISSSGYSPATVTIHKGDYVQFTNTDTTTHWPASDPHPTHTGYPGFDADQALKTGENYRFQFEKVGTWGYHDHLHPNLKGTVIVK
jgi:plastocyanin